MKKKRAPIIKDERTEKLDGQIASEIVLGLVILLLVSMFVKVYFFQLTLMAYLPELILVIGIGLYSLIRRLSAGVDIRDMYGFEGKWYDRLGESALFILVLTVIDVVAQRETFQSLLSLDYLYKVLFYLPFFAVVSYVLDKFLAIVNRKRQERLEQELETDE